MEKGNQKIKELKSSNPSGYDTRYIINFHKADISAQQTEYSEVLKKLNEKLAAGSISKNAYEEAVIKAGRRPFCYSFLSIYEFTALPEFLQDFFDFSRIYYFNGKKGKKYVVKGSRQADERLRICLYC